MDKLLTKNKATLESGEEKIKKFDEDIKTKTDEIEKTKQLVVDLNAQIDANVEKAEQL